MTISAGVPVVSGTEEERTTGVIRRRCRELGADLYQYGEAFATEAVDDGAWRWQGLAGTLAGLGLPGLRCSMRGSYQVRNASLSLAVIALLADRGFAASPADIRAGLLGVRWPGRLEYLALDRTTRKQVFDLEEEGNLVHYLLDGAHNPAGVDSLVSTLKEEYTYRRLLVVWGAMVDKDLATTIPAIGAMADRIIFTRPAGERAAEPAQLLTCLPAELQARAELVVDVTQALLTAEQEVGPGDLIVVAGSLYLIGAVRTFLLGELVDE